MSQITLYLDPETEAKLKALLQDFKFCPLGKLVEQYAVTTISAATS